MVIVRSALRARFSFFFCCLRRRRSLSDMAPARPPRPIMRYHWGTPATPAHDEVPECRRRHPRCTGRRRRRRRRAAARHRRLRRRLLGGRLTAEEVARTTAATVRDDGLLVDAGVRRRGAVVVSRCLLGAG